MCTIRHCIRIIQQIDWVCLNCFCSPDCEFQLRLLKFRAIMEMRADKTGGKKQIGPSKVPSHFQASRSIIKRIIMWKPKDLRKHIFSHFTLNSTGNSLNGLKVITSQHGWFLQSEDMPSASTSENYLFKAI